MKHPSDDDGVDRTVVRFQSPASYGPEDEGGYHVTAFQWIDEREARVWIDRVEADVPRRPGLWGRLLRSMAPPPRYDLVPSGVVGGSLFGWRWEPSTRAAGWDVERVADRISRSMEWKAKEDRYGTGLGGPEIDGSATPREGGPSRSLV